jgi:predicted nucleic acid-binding protein
MSFEATPRPPLLPRSIEIAARTGARVYDCLYVALAVSLDCRLVTADRRLIAKMAETGHAALMADLNSFTASP